MQYFLSAQVKIIQMHIQAAGVAYGIQSYIDQNSKFLESCMHQAHGLNLLLTNYGAEVRLTVSQISAYFYLGSKCNLSMNINTQLTYSL